MNILTPNLRLTPRARVVVNSLYNSKDPDVLTQDLMLVELPNQTYIDVSWFPEHDPTGAYCVSVIRNRVQIHEAEASTAPEALMMVQALATVFTQDIGNVACSAAQIVIHPKRPAA